MVAPEKGKSSIRIQQYKTFKALVVENREGQDQEDNNYRGNEQAFYILSAACPPDPNEQKRDEQKE